MKDRFPLTILYVEDEPAIRKAVTNALMYNFARVLNASNGKEGLGIFVAENPDIVVCDIRMPIMDGLELSKEIINLTPTKPIILTTAFTETEYLLKAIDLGVSAYVRKPLDSKQLIKKIIQVAEPILRIKELEAMRVHEKSSLELLLGKSETMKQIIQKVQRVASTDYSIVIQGETGTGKSYLASIIHGLSTRRQHAFITLNLCALPEALVESELFGHTRGAFTGAVDAKVGLFGEAHGGTIFIDDIDCATPAIQTKIIHAVEEKCFTPLGGTKKIDVDARIIVASNLNLLLESQNGKFRNDLYYRLADVVLTLPPLRDRDDDIVMLANKFIFDASLELDKTPPRLTSEAIALLRHYPWQGNVRELKSIIKRVVLFGSDIISSADLNEFTNVIHQPGVEIAPPLRSLDELIRNAISEALDATCGNKTAAANLLKLEYRKFKRMLDKLQL